MIEYFPWSNKVLQDILNDFAHGQFSILDLELGGECNCNCIYCDSPNRKEKVLYSIEMIEKFIEKGCFKWLFVCGLGEPTFNENYDIIIKLLQFCDKKKIKCSIFTNATNITEELKKFIHKGILYILFKCDSLIDEVNKKITGNDCISSYNDIFLDIVPMVKVENGCSNIAASIVPTIYNEDLLVELVQKCITYNVFPLIGSLENAGKAHINYEKLAITKEKQLFLKSQIEHYLGEEYKLPICPSTIGAIHITNKGDIVLDSKSGLSCSWFWMKSPCTITLGNISEFNVYDEICKRIIEYRKSIKNTIGNMASVDVDNVFGGCGGNISELLFLLNNN